MIDYIGKCKGTCDEIGSVEKQMILGVKLKKLKWINHKAYSEVK